MPSARTRAARTRRVSFRAADHLAKTFRQLADRWRAETRFVSSVEKLSMNPSYQRIIGMGAPAVPLLLRELKEKPDHWFWALEAITGANPVPVEDQGDIQKMAEAWLSWGHQHRYL